MLRCRARLESALLTKLHPLLLGAALLATSPFGCTSTPAQPEPAFIPSYQRPATVVVMPPETPKADPPLPTVPLSIAAPGTAVLRFEDEIMIAGQRFRTGTPVVLWTDPGGYDAYRVDKRFGDFQARQFADWEDTSQNPQRYNIRDHRLSRDQVESHRGGSWTLAQLQQVIDQVVIHYDVAGTSRRCFEVLHDRRHLSCHFLLDLDGTIYQTLDLKERAWHAGESNSRGIGIEIANLGAYPDGETFPWTAWAKTDARGRTYYLPPDPEDAESFRTPGFKPMPARAEPVRGIVQGQSLTQLDFTPQQYAALSHLLATLHQALPQIQLDAPRGPDGRVTTDLLPPARREGFQGLVGHYHVSSVKIDPGPAFDWEKVIQEARRLAP